MTTTSAPAIEVRGLRKTYGPVVAVDHVDLTVSEGEIFGVLGPNGSGKSTTVECIAGLRRPDAGSVRILGLDPVTDRDAVKRTVGVQLQSAGLQAKLRVREALDLFASFYDDPRDPLELATRLGLGERLDHPWRKLSGGQQQRLAIALALVGRPKVALLDELSTGLDPRSRREVWELVEEIRAEGTTILLVTHLMEEAQHLCDRIALVQRGRILVTDTPDGLIGRTAAPLIMSFVPDRTLDVAALTALGGVSDVMERSGRMQVACDDTAVLAVLDRLRDEGVRPEHLRISESSLDEAYLDLITADADASESDATAKETVR
ncbi:ABC transporter ATP-binding protein [Mumia sp. ZJ430]|uniref:ABC transporter ATP-binding protein n=1 Tax=Mumia sp. ZJ430 TaxID=2708083 RepID=UPI00141E8713|nr:ABC transporter ATP-binding protein [Mumia sp. ZJ430]